MVVNANYSPGILAEPEKYPELLALRKMALERGSGLVIHKTLT